MTVDAAGTSVHVIGLGVMGSAMAACLQRSGLTVTGSDVSHEAVERARRTGLAAEVIAMGEHIVVGGAEVILSCVPADRELRDVASRLQTAESNPQGSNGTVLIDASTVLPTTICEIAETLRPRIQVVDAAVSGGPDQASAGTLTLYSGGHIPDDSPAQRVLNLLGDTIVDCGELGHAKLVKILNNTMSWANTTIAAEVMALGVDLGLDESWLFHALKMGNGRSHQFEKRFARLISGDNTANFTLAMGIKDIHLANLVAADSKSPMPLAAALLSALEGIDEKWANEDIASSYHFYREAADSIGITTMKGKTQ